MAERTVQPSAALKVLEREYKSKAVEATALFEVLVSFRVPIDTKLIFSEPLEAPCRERDRV